MGKLEVILPAMGEGIIEATITKWLVREGEYIKEEQPLLEVATDKVDSEIPSPVSGTLSRIIYKEGEIPKIGEVLALIESEQIHNIITTPEPEPTILRQEKKSPAVFEDTTFKAHLKSYTSSIVTSPIEASGSESLISPFIRHLAKQREISFNELIQIKGSGLHGRITKEDLHSYILVGRPFRKIHSFAKNIEQNENIQQVRELKTTVEKIVPGEGEELIEMDRTRKLIAAHMVRSKRTSPHVTSMVEIDVTNLVQWRDLNKEKFLEKYGTKLTYTPVFVVAAVEALKEFPGINISVSGDYIIKKKYINIGIATALPDGNLIVPVIKDADKRNFVNISLHLADLADRARLGKLEPLEVKGGTFTITNMGQYDNISGTPIINQPEVAILAIGAIKKKPAVLIVEGQQTIGIRDIMILSLTYDHRVLDGALGGSFVRAIGRYLEGSLPEF